MHKNNIPHSYMVNSKEEGKGFNYNGLFLKVRDLKLWQVARCSLNICFPLGVLNFATLQTQAASVTSPQ